MGSIQLKRPEPVLDLNNPFSDDTLLDRADFSKELSELVADAEEPLVVALNGAWGTGKTYFLDRWIQSMRNMKGEGRAPTFVISYNAWQDDDVDDPLLALVGQLHHYLHSRCKKDDATVKEDMSSKVAALGRTVCDAASVVVKHAGRCVDHFLGIDPAALVHDFANYQAKRVVDYSTAIQARVDLKNRLADLANAVWEESGHPLIFVIDDLDRCRPVFAISLLERVEHLFNVRHVVFVLGVDKGQLSSSLQHVYGEKFDADNYLFRIIDFEVMLPPPSYRSFVGDLLTQYELEKYLKAARPTVAKGEELPAIGEFKDVTTYLATRYKLSLRAVERIIRDVILIERLHLTLHPLNASLLVLLVALRVCDEAIYNSFVTGKQHPKATLDKIFTQESKPGQKLSVAERHIAIITYASSRSSKVKDALQHLALCITDKNRQPATLPRRLLEDAGSIGDIVKWADASSITHENVVEITNALANLRNWKEREW